MPQPALPHHSEIDPRYTWNAESVFPTVADWEAELEAVAAALPALSRFQGRLAEGPAVLAEAMEAIQALVGRVGRLMAYATMAQAVDTADQAAARRLSQAQSLMAQLRAAVAYVEPELLAIGRETLSRWLAEYPPIAYLDHYLDDLFRKAAHVRSAEVEALLGLLADPFSGSRAVHSVLTNAEFRFAPARTADGQELPVSQGTLDRILRSPDRTARRTAWESYADQYLAFKNTLATNLNTSVSQNVFLMRARGHRSTLEMALFANNIPVEVFHNLIATYRRHLPTWHRYWALRRRALGVDALYPYDVWAPLTGQTPTIPYEQAVAWICEGLAPLGEEYVETVRRGCLEERWVDVYPCRGKRAGAFSAGAPGSYPFINMSYADDVFSLSTLAHELGHSMHSYLSWQSQPILYARYSLFAAEVASNFHQAMVRAHLLRNGGDPALQIALLEEAMSNFHRYFLVMPTLAQWELAVHQRAEQRRPFTADEMIELLADLFTEAYGPAMTIDRPRVGIQWATFGHMFMDYYVYQYATGIAGAHALARRVLDGVPGAADRYLHFLRSGGSRYPLDALAAAGVDLASPQPVEETFAVLADYVDRLAALLSLPPQETPQ
ncbi:MAG: oligoendopeptidase F [Caldilineales bacterium]|nr:oligoendopeptidase F [Caldilineales bacterium]MDW8316731.1 oligoendopeptidase F [Anaerolineae bacterium]